MLIIKTHDEREARSEKNLCAHKSDITMSLTLLATDKTESHQNWEKSLHLASEKLFSRARHVFLWKIASRFSLALCVCSIKDSK